MDLTELYPRFLEHTVNEALSDTPVVVIQGARQVGKSTLTNALTGGSTGVVFTTLDDSSALAVAESDPAFFVDQAGPGLLVIDEAQRAPNLILPLKASVDRDRRAGRFLLTGSADLLQVKGAGDSLAGRAETVELKPLSQGEIARRRTPEDFVTRLLDSPTFDLPQALSPSTVISGGYPESVRRSPGRAHRWLNSYIDRLADHDARELHQGGYSGELRRLLTIIASGGQQELVKAKVSRSIGISEHTVASYLRLATSMRLVTSLPSWGRSLRGRITRRPKVSLADTGLAAALVGFTAERASSIGGREYYGSLVEQFVVLELAKQRDWSATSFSLFHFRDLDGLEVDVIAELADGRLVAIEVKSSVSVTDRAWANLIRFRDRFPDREVIGVCFHGGTQVGRIDDWLHVLPVSTLWEH